jgi:hypothetical protein
MIGRMVNGYAFKVLVSITTLLMLLILPIRFWATAILHEPCSQTQADDHKLSAGHPSEYACALGS